MLSLETGVPLTASPSNALQLGPPPSADDLNSHLKRLKASQPQGQARRHLRISAIVERLRAANINLSREILGETKLHT